jgi:arylsulfatase A-like enzyme
MKKNLRMKKLIFLVCFLVLLANGLQAQTKKPNIIYIMADDLGYGDLGCYGQTKIKTPEIDKMASEGMLFTQHYAGSPVCMPSRAVLLTGKNTGHATVRGNPRWTATGVPVNLNDSDITVADELKRAGYTTAIIGKWGLSEGTVDHMPQIHGFDYFFGYKDHKDAHHYYFDTLYRNNKPIILKENNPQTKKGKYIHDMLAAEALQYIRKQRDDPFFLYLAFTIPHLEMTVPEEAKEQYKDLGWPERKMKMGHYRNDPEGNTTYAGMVSRMDKDVGSILDLLQELGIDDNTLVIFTSDNGHEFDRGFFNSNGSLRGKKRDLYEGGIRIPMIARWPGYIEAGTVTEHVSAFWYFLPTACDLAGINPSDPSIDGISYLPAMTGEYSEQKKHDFLYWEFNEKNGPRQAVRMNDWKLVKYYGQDYKLFNLSKDIGENNDLSRKYPEKLEQLKTIMKDARTEHTAFPLTKRKIN